MTDEARDRLMEAVTGAVAAYIEDVAPSEPDTGDPEEDWDRPMDYEELEDLCVHIPTAVISYITGMSIDGIRNYFKRRVSVPQDVASKVRRLHRLLEELAAEKHVHRRGGARPRKSPPPDTGKRQQKKSK